MTPPIRRTDCSALGTFTDELIRLAELGFQAAPHADVQRLKPGEFLIHMPARPHSKGRVCICYRE